MLFSDGQVGSSQELNGDFSAWTTVQTPTGSTVIANDTSNPHHGSKNFKISSTGVSAGATGPGFGKSGFGAYNNLFARVQNFRFHPTGSETEFQILCFDNAFYENYCRLQLRKIGSDWVLSHYSWGKDAEQYVLQPDTNYCLEFEFIRTDSTHGEIKIYVNGTQHFDKSGSLDGSRNPNYVICGISYCNAALGNGFSLTYDCVVIADAYIGPENTVTPQTVTDSFLLADTLSRNKHVNVADDLGADDTAKGNKTLILTDITQLFTTPWLHKTLNTQDELTLSDTASTPLRVLQSTDAVALIETIQAGAGGAKKTRLFLLIGDLALDISGT